MTRPSVLVLAQRDDVGARAIASLLRQRAVCEVTLADEFAFSRDAVFHAPESGRAGEDASGGLAAAHPSPEGSARRRSGVDPERPYDVILCRATTFRSRRFRQRTDDEYAAAEMHAFGLSWLWSRRDIVVNPPTPACLSGAAPDLLGVARACAAVGLATPAVLLATDAARVDRARLTGPTRRPWVGVVPGDYDAAPVDGGPPLAAPALWIEELLPERLPVLVCRDRLVDAPPALAGRLRQLATSIGLPLAEIRLARSAGRPGGMVVVGISPVPALQGAAQLRVVATDLELRASAHRERAVA
ncbi:hypothetical protein [Agromyces humatus]|uniref:Uncharacterized protein n=1 Tax=Agromyces humatus TaxID=279573 RepID=A0ABN2KJC3_9MICO|nr:hypothetical protein [Agromyces humatus]